MQDLQELKNKRLNIQRQEDELRKQEQGLKEREEKLNKEIDLKEHEVEVIVEAESFHHIIMPAFVGHFFRLMNSFYDHLVKIYPHVTYCKFCHYLSLRFRFSKSYEAGNYLSPITVLSYFKKERAGEYYRV